MTNLNSEIVSSTEMRTVELDYESIFECNDGLTSSYNIIRHARVTDLVRCYCEGCGHLELDQSRAQMDWCLHACVCVSVCVCVCMVHNIVAANVQYR